MSNGEVKRKIFGVRERQKDGKSTSRLSVFPFSVKTKSGDGYLFLLNLFFNQIYL